MPMNTAVLAAILAASPAGAPGPHHELARLEYGAVPDPAPRGGGEVAIHQPYGSKDSWRWYLTGGGGLDINESSNSFGEVGGGVNYYFLQNLSLLTELNLQYYSQIGNDAIGFNWNLLLRWDFLAYDTWSLYADAGAGIMLSTEAVPGPEPEQPVGGGTFHFNPQIGLGFSVEVAPNVRFLGGTRWSHLSNANTSEPNPPRDSLMFYAGVSVPF